MIGRTGVQALKALLELALEPSRWRSVNDLATAQGLPAPHLEQLLLRLRRAGVLEARRGRQGGYRLVAPPAELSLARILAAVGAWPKAGVASPKAGVPKALGSLGDSAVPRDSADPNPLGVRGDSAVAKDGAIAKDSAALQSLGALQAPFAPPSPPAPGADPATERVATLLRQRLARAIERELERLTLAELLYDLRSARAGLSEEGGLMLG